MKKRLMASLLSLLVCVSMLIGSTFAWFTDKATTGVNTIQAGKLDVALEMWDPTAENNAGAWVTAEGQTLNFIKADGAPAGEAVLWEPGAAYKLPQVRIVNDGTLKLKYQIALSAVNGNTTGNGADLADVIDVYFGEDLASAEKQGTLASILATNGGVFNDGTLTPDETATYGTIILKMQESAGNEYQGLSLNSIAIAVHAAQATGESDSFGNTYDENAEYLILAPYTELKKVFEDALAKGGNVTVNLTKSYDAEGKWTALVYDNYAGANITSLTINGNGNTIANMNEPLVGNWNITIAIDDLTLEDAKISSIGYQGGYLGAFVAYSESVVTLTQCKLINSMVISTHEEGCTGGMMGYDPNIADFANCEVSGSTIAGKKYAGGLIGMTYGSTVTNAKITGTTFNDDAKYRGVVAAHCLSKQSTFTNITASDNNITELCGRNTVPPIIN